MVTRYEQVAIEISGLISRGILRPGDRIPSVRKACQQYRANAGTIPQAYGELENSWAYLRSPAVGLLRSSPGNAPGTRARHIVAA